MCLFLWRTEKKNKCEAEKECGDSCVQKKWKEACPTIQDLTEKNDVDFSEASKEVKKMMKSPAKRKKNKECEIKELQANIEKCAMKKRCADARQKIKCNEVERKKKREEEEKMKKCEEEAKNKICQVLVKTQEDIMKVDGEFKNNARAKAVKENAMRKLKESA